ncbi:MAG: allantoinase AllB, partial [Bdellovibrionota bacterium]
PPDPAARIDDAGDLVIMPGLVDSHVHVNEPGRTDGEGFETATQAAAAGGATTLVDMPLNCIPVTTTAKAFRAKLEAVAGKLAVDVGFWGGAIGGGQADLPRLLDSGVLGVKTFLIDSGIPEFPPMTLSEIDAAMPELARRGLPYLFHAELDGGEKLPDGPDYETFLHSRPKSWENNAIKAVIELARKHNAHVHIVHLSSSEALPMIAAAKKDGVKLTVETCPHYLLLSNTQVEKFEPASERTLFKCCPPIREEANRQALWEGLLSGVIDMVVSDHSPCTPALKKFGSADFGAAWGGISSLQYTLSLLWTEGQRHCITFPQLTKWLCEGPARLAGLSQKGSIAPGSDADFVLFDSNAKTRITFDGTFHRHKNSPYQGRELQGKVCRTILRGETIFDAGKFPVEPRGGFLLRGNG